MAEYTEYRRTQEVEFGAGFGDYDYNTISTPAAYLDRIMKYYSSQPPKNPLPDLSFKDFHKVRQHCLARTPWSNSRVLAIAPSVVSVSFFAGVQRKLDHSGFIIEWNEDKKEATILTTSRFVRVPKEVSWAEFNVMVRLSDGRLLVADVDMIDYCHNIITLKVKSDVPLPEVELCDLDESDRSSYTALGRDFFTCDLLDSTGTVEQFYPFFGAPGLRSSTCPMTEVGEGGPLVNCGGLVCGIMFFDHCGYGHVLPSSAIISSLRHRERGLHVQPWFGINVLDGDQLPNYARERLDTFGACVVVKEVCEGSVAQEHGVCPGDILNSCNGYQISSVNEYSRVLAMLSKELNTSKSKDDRPRNILASFRSLQSGNIISCPAEILDVTDKKFCFSWLEDERFYLRAPRFGSQKHVY